MPADAAAASALWDMEAATVAEWDAAGGGDCECAGPPPEFRLPPPPRPPPMAEALDCSEAPLPDIETCDAVPVMDAEFHSSPAIPSLAVIVVCSVLLVAMVLIASALVWKHKRKMQNFLPCKTSPQNRCDAAAANGVIYEDLTNLRPRPLPQLAPGHTPCIEMVDVKGSGIFVCPAPPRADPYASQDLYNPVYEELSNGSAERCAESDAESEAAAAGSEDDFADEELSLGGEVEGGGDGGGVGAGGSLTGGSSSSDASSPPRPSARPPAPRHTPSLQQQQQQPLQRHPGVPRHDHRGPAHHAPRYVPHLQSADSLAAAAAKEAMEEERGRYTLAAPARGYGIPAAFRAAPTLPTTAAERRGRSLDRRRGWRSKGSQPPAPPPSQPPPPPHEFHEGMLLDALLQLYPGGGGGRQPGVPSVAHRLPYLMPPTAAVPAAGGGGGGGAGGGSRLVNPYDSVPVLNHLHQQHHAPAAYMFSTFRPPASHDSSFGSDSGYSNHTSGGGGGGGSGGGGGAGGSSGRTASRSRKDTAHRLSAHSGDLVMS